MVTDPAPPPDGHGHGHEPRTTDHGSRPEARPDAESEAESESEAEAESESESESESEAESEAGFEAESEAESEPESESEAESKSEAESEAESEAGSESESEAQAKLEPEAGEEGTAENAENAEKEQTTEAEPWQPPVLLGDYISHYSIKAIRGTLLVLCLGWLVLCFLWAVPTVVAMRSPGYALAKDHAQRDRTVMWLVGSPMSSERVPRRYRLEDDRAEFEFVVRGPMGRARVVAEVRGGKVTSFRREVEAGWRDVWMERRRRNKAR